MAEYFAIATLAFLMGGDARGPVCARAAKATRRGFARETKRPGPGAVTGEKLVELRGR